MTQLITNATTNYDIMSTGPKHLTNKRFVDKKKVEMGAAATLYADQKADTAKRYTDETASDQTVQFELSGALEQHIYEKVQQLTYVNNFKILS